MKTAQHLLKYNHQVSSSAALANFIFRQCGNRSVVLLNKVCVLTFSECILNFLPEESRLTPFFLNSIKKLKERKGEWVAITPVWAYKLFQAGTEARKPVPFALPEVLKVVTDGARPFDFFFNWSTVDFEMLPFFNKAGVEMAIQRYFYLHQEQLNVSCSI
jgi:hypothetical protein